MIEHLKAFAHPLGVQVLIENLQNEITTPEHILEILRVGHFDRVGVCLDIGHAHLSRPENNIGIDEAFELLKPRIAQIHLHDNQGQHDNHLWPGSGTIDWNNIARQASTLPADTTGLLEIAHDLEETPESVTTKATQAFDFFKRNTEQLA